MNRGSNCARTVALPLILAGLAYGWHSSAIAQASPNPSPTLPSADTPEQVAARFRRMEETNQRLLQQFETMAKQNEALTRQVQDLSRRLDAPTPTVALTAAPPTAGDIDETAPSLGESSARPSRYGALSPSSGVPGFNAGTINLPGDNTAPVLSEDSARPSRSAGPSKGARALPLKAYYDQQRYGYLMQSDDSEFELRFNALLQTDARIYTNTMNPVVNDIDMPRMRMYFSGRMTRPFEYQLSFQRSTNSLDVLNAFINIHYDDRFQLKIGRYKPPYTFEWYKMSIWEMLTPDRSPFALNFGPNRQVGVMPWGFLFKERLEYAVGVFDGPRNSYQDSNNAKDVMALLDYKPFFQSGNLALKNFAIGGSLDQGYENNPLVPAMLRTSTSASSNTLSSTSGDSLISVPFLAFNNNVRERGERQLFEIHSSYFYKGLSLLGVWDVGHNGFGLTTPGARPVNLPVSGFMLQSAYLLTGETRERLSLVDPIRPFNPRRGQFGLGAVELQARYSELALGNQVFTGGLADPNLWSNRVDLLDVGVNWYLNKFVKVYVDWEHAVFGQPVYAGPGALQKTNDLIWLRLQIYL